MKRAVLIVALLVGVTLVTAQAGGTPKIVFDQIGYDFGTTSKVQSVSGSLPFRNDGDGELQVTKIDTTCACTYANAHPTKLQPGETGSLDFGIKLGPSVGTIVEQIFLSSNDPKNPMVTLTLMLYVKPIFEVTPSEFRLGDLQKGSTTNLTVLVQRTDGQKLRITKVVSDNPLISARIKPVKDSKDPAAQILIKFKAADRPGSFEDAVKVHTGEMYAEDLPKPSFEIKLKGRVVDSH
jgi:hypothetical protein